MKPHQALRTIRADEIAECWDGVSKALYSALWNKIVPLQKAIPNIEDSGPADHVGHENVAKHWKRLTVEEQTELNALAAKREEGFNRFLSDLSDKIPDLDDNLATAGHAEPAHDAEPVRGRLMSAAAATRFALAGKATLTLVSEKTQARFTYRISANNDSTCHFVALLSGPDNESDYQYMGRISRGIYWHGRKAPRAGDIGPDAPSAKAFDYVWRALARGEMPNNCEIWHESHCGRCGRKLTVPSSVSQGFGPECVNKL